jgi:hypothetical protein
MRSIRAELAGLGFAVGDAELAACDLATRLAAFGLVESEFEEPLPEGLLETVATFDDLAHFANVRRGQEGLVEDWTA